VRETLKTPVALFVFNRPETTTQVFSALREAAPSKLFVVADGPRPDRPGEAELCASARSVATAVDWECDVHTLYSDINLGCRRRMSSGIDWVFEQTEEAIILEDDCLPHPTFFPFCQELLARYRKDERIAHIGGCNFQFGRRPSRYSYYFSRYNHVWGWASWRRAWKRYGGALERWPETRGRGEVGKWFRKERERRFWTGRFDALYRGEVNSWAYQWTLSCWQYNRLTILPNVNLISNIGFAADATHTRIPNRLSNVPLSAMRFPLVHPLEVHRDMGKDDFTERLAFSGLSNLRKAYRKFVGLLGAR
jgi:hypothetical protein